MKSFRLGDRAAVAAVAAVAAGLGTVHARVPPVQVTTSTGQGMRRISSSSFSLK